MRPPERDKSVAELRQRRADYAERARKLDEERAQERQRQLERWISWGIAAVAGVVFLILFMAFVI